jgi:transcriptional regulator with XRE-family HTH domain
MGSTLEFRKAFVARLAQACDDSKLIPPQGRGRQNYIAARMGLAPEAISKWFKGVSMPRQDKMAFLAELLEVDQSWLAFGIKAEMDRTERRVHAKESDGAVHLVWGMFALAGGHCGEPSQADPRAAYVDFYATMRGSVYPIHVSLAREVSRDRFEVILPREYVDVHTVAVVPAGPGRFHFLRLPRPLVDEHKTKKGGALAVTISRVDSKYITGSDTWPRVKSFEGFL